MFSSSFTDLNQTEACVEVRNVSKRYKLFASSLDRLKEYALFGRRLYHQEFWPVRNISLSLRRGETVGIIGKNGSGKSTLLQLICGILTPSQGTVTTKGRLSALLELGTGFNPLFTGKENIFINAALLGIKKQEIIDRYSSIIEFADIGAFIDRPVKTYSSGMLVRLAFAVATSFTPDILVVDEALSVGDEMFQKKCFSRIKNMQKQGATILFVSHTGQNIIDLCSKALLLDGGELIASGDPKIIVGHYQRLIYASTGKQQQIKQELKEQKFSSIKTQPYPLATAESKIVQPSNDEQTPNEQSTNIRTSWWDDALKESHSIHFEENGAHAKNIKLSCKNGNSVNTISHGLHYTFSYEVDFSEDIEGAIFMLQIKTAKGLNIAGKRTAPNTFHEKSQNFRKGAHVKVSFEFKCILNSGLYDINITIRGKKNESDTIICRKLDVLPFKVLPIEESRVLGIVDIVNSCDVTLLCHAQEDH